MHQAPTPEALLDALMETRKLVKRIENGDLCACEWRMKVEGGTMCAQCALKIFFGAQWMLAVETPMGEFLVARRNAGAREVEIGSTVHLAWAPHDLRILPAEHEVSA